MILLTVLVSSLLQTAFPAQRAFHVCQNGKETGEIAGKSGTIFVEGNCALTLTGIYDGSQFAFIGAKESKLCVFRDPVFLNGEQHCVDTGKTKTSGALVNVTAGQIEIEAKQTQSFKLQYYRAFNFSSNDELEINNEGGDVYYAGVIPSIDYLPKTIGPYANTRIFNIPIGAYITYTLIILQERKSFSGDQRIRVDRGADRNIIFDASISSPFSHEHTEKDSEVIWIFFNYISNNKTANVDFFLKFEVVSCNIHSIPHIDHATYTITNNRTGMELFLPGSVFVDYTCEGGYKLENRKFSSVECTTVSQPREGRQDGVTTKLVSAMWSEHQAIKCTRGEAKTGGKTAAITITVVTLLLIVIILLAYKMYHDWSDVNSAIREFQVKPKEDNAKVHVVSDQAMVIHSGRRKRKATKTTKIKNTNKMEKAINLSDSTMRGASQPYDRGEKIEASLYYPVADPLTNVMESGLDEAKEKKKGKRKKRKKLQVEANHPQ